MKEFKKLKVGSKIQIQSRRLGSLEREILKVDKITKKYFKCGGFSFYRKDGVQGKIKNNESAYAYIKTKEEINEFLKSSLLNNIKREIKYFNLNTLSLKDLKTIDSIIRKV